MENIIDEKRAKINELQKLAKEVQLLKSEHRQKRPIVIEFSGSPKAGKTSCINALELFLKRNDFKVKVIQERASVCPVSDKQSPMFNFWTSCMSISGMIGTLEDKNNNVDVLILDRGIFDALCWFEWLVSTSKMESEQRDIAEKFFLMDDFVKPIDVVFAFCTKPEISIQREYANLLTDKLGTIMNHKVLGEYLNAIERTIKNKKKSFHNVFKVDTSNMPQDDVNFEVTQKTLRTLKDLLMERIGYFHKTNEILDVIATQSVISFNKLNRSLPRMKFDLREIVENNGDLLQPIPIAVIVNLDKTKVLTKKEQKSCFGYIS